MPEQARVSGEMYDANGQPVEGGKVVATLVGDDFFTDGRQIITDDVETTTDEFGRWEIDLLVNREGDSDSTTWTIKGWNELVKPVFERKGLFIASSAAITISDLVKTSAANLAAAKAADLVNFFLVEAFAEYTALPAGQKAASDVILVRPGG